MSRTINNSLTRIFDIFSRNLLSKILLSIFVVFLTSSIPAFANDKVILQLRWDNQFQFAGYYAAQWYGFYEDAGLDVEIRPGVSKDGLHSAIQEVASGNAHFGIGGADVLKARDNGLPLILVASIFQHSAAGFYTRTDTKITTPKDFLKLKVARQVDDLIDIELQALLIAGGVDPKKVKAYPHQSGLNHLLSGEVDVIPGYTISTLTTAKVQKAAISELRPITYGVDFYGDSIFTSNSLVDDNPKLVAQFKSASLKGWEYALNHPEEIIKRISSDLPRAGVVANLHEFNKQQHQSMIRLINYPDVDLGNINIARWEKMYNLLEILGIVKNPLDIDTLIFNPEKIERIKTQKRLKFVSWILFPVITLLLCILFWSFFLRKTVSRRTQELEVLNEKLAKSEQKYRNLVDDSPDIQYRTDMEGNILFISKSVFNLTGYSVDEALEMKEMKQHYLNPEERNRFIAALVKNGSVNDFETELIRKDGVTWWATTNARLIKNKHGKNIAIEGVTRDITERKTIELELVKSKSQFESIIIKLPFPIVVTDNNNNILFLNDKFTELFGYTIDDIPTIEHYWAAAYPDLDYQKAMRHKWKEAIETATKEGTDVEPQERDIIIKNQEKRRCEIFMVPLENISLMVMNDITLRILNENEQERLKSRLQHAEKMESIGILAGGIAHDFNNILSSILGFTELALRATDKEAPVYDDLQEVYSGGIRAQELVRQILTFARQSTNKAVPVLVSAIVKETWKFIRSTIPSTIQIHSEINSDALVLGDATEIHQIIMNLCTNAAHAIGSGQGKLSISLTPASSKEIVSMNLAPHKHGYIKIMVEDTGVGMPQDIIDSIFNPYFTTKAVGDGTGMGLAVVHGIVEKYKGKIVTKSAQGEGTSFSIYLPITTEDSEEVKREENKLLLGQGTILLVDDEAAIVKLTTRFLSRFGYDVVGSNDSIEASKILTNNPEKFDLVITDMTMPELTGVELANELFEIREELPFIICTGYSNAFNEDSELPQNVKAMLHKPLKEKQLASIVKKVLEQNDE